MASAAWDAGAWAVPSGDVDVDGTLAADIVALGSPFLVDREAHRRRALASRSSCRCSPPRPPGRGSCRSRSRRGPGGVRSRRERASAACSRRVAPPATRIVLAISSDMAHYPPADACELATQSLLPAILGLDPARLAALEEGMRHAGIRGLSCGMCGIDPAVLGLAALRAMGATAGTMLAASTSADAGGPPDRTVGYLAARFDA